MIASGRKAGSNQAGAYPLILASMPCQNRQSAACLVMQASKIKSINTKGLKLIQIRDTIPSKNNNNNNEHGSKCTSCACQQA